MIHIINPLGNIRGALRTRILLEWGGVRKLPHGLRFSCVGAGAGWGVLSSVNNETQLFREKFRIFAQNSTGFGHTKAAPCPLGLTKQALRCPSTALSNELFVISWRLLSTPELQFYEIGTLRPV